MLPGMKKITEPGMFLRFIEDESGATAIEYGLIAMLLSIAIVVGAGSVSDALQALFSNAGNQIADAVNNN
jgi:pilus assembly protein Flp/PilA